MDGSPADVLRFGIMKRRAVILLMFSTLLLTGCLFTVNHPRLAADGTMALFLESEGGYTLFSETGVLHLLRDGEWIAVPAATLGGAGGLLDLSPDGAEALYVDVRSEEFLDAMTSTLYRVALRPEAVPEPIWETESAIAKAVWAEEEWILLLLFGEEDLATLRALNLATGETERLAGDLLSFAVLPERDELILVAADEGGRLSLGFVVRWDAETDLRDTLAEFVLSEETFEAFFMLPHEFFWDVAPDGSWVALCLYDGTLIEPAIDSEIPSLYLIDVDGGGVQRIAADALLPAFSPDGTGLIYAVEAEGGAGILMWRDLPSERTIAIPGSEGVSTAFWLSPTRLGMTFEAGEDRYRLLELDVITEQIDVLFGAD